MVCFVFLIWQHLLTCTPQPQPHVSKITAVTVYSADCLQGDSNVMEKFVIDPTTGVLHLQEMLDYEKQREYRFTVVASDRAATNSLTGQTEVVLSVTNVNDEAPKISLELLSEQPDRETLELSEATPVGTLVGLLQVTDEDSSSVQCTLHSTSKFRLLRVQSNSSEFRIVTASVFDREISPYELINVQCNDVGDRLQLTTGTSVRVHITDENDCTPEFLNVDAYPSYSDGVLQLQVMENNFVGTLRITLVFT